MGEKSTRVGLRGVSAAFVSSLQAAGGEGILRNVRQASVHWDSGNFAAGVLGSGEAAGPEVLSPHTWISH